MAERRFGNQPIRDYVWRTGWSLQEFAELSGVRPVTHVIQAMEGRCPASPALRRAATEMLQLPPEVLWTADSLATVYRPRRGRARSARGAVA